MGHASCECNLYFEQLNLQLLTADIENTNQGEIMKTSAAYSSESVSFIVSDWLKPVICHVNEYKLIT